MQAPTATPQQPAFPMSPPGRSYKNILQETLVGGHTALEIRYLDSMMDQAQNPTKQLLWTSTVHLVDTSSGTSMLSATGQDSRKTSAQAAAAARLMALPTFEPLLQRLHRPSVAKPLLVPSTPLTSPTAPGPQTPMQPAAVRPAAATPPGTSPVGQQWAAPGVASPPGVNALLIPAASGSMPATVNGHSAAFLVPNNSTAAALLPGSLAALSHLPGMPSLFGAAAPAAAAASTAAGIVRGPADVAAPPPPGLTPHTPAQLSAPLTAFTSQDAVVSAPAAAGLLSAAAVGSAGTGPQSSSTSSTTADVIMFHPDRNYKGQLQEMVQLTRGAVRKPAYSCTAQGLPHLQVFTATVVIAPSVPPPLPAAAAAAAGAPAASLPAAAAAVDGSGGAGLWPAAGVLAATGTGQSTRMKAEQAAAAVALHSPEILALLQSLKPASSVKPPAAAQAAQQQQALLSAQGITAMQPSSAAVSSTALMAPPAPPATPAQQQQTEGTPTQQLHTLANQAAWCLEPICPRLLRGASQSPVYEASIVINGHLLAVGRGNSKAAATHAAAARALQCMQQPTPGVPVGRSGSMAHGRGAAGSGGSGSSSCTGVSRAEVQDASLAVFAQLAQQGVSSKILSAATVTQTALCTILLQRGSSKPTVVALGTGTGFYASDVQELAVPAHRGMLLLDCHGEVVARRSFLRWLYAQAAMVLLLHKQLQVMQAQGMTAAAAAAAAAVLQHALDALPLEVVSGSADSRRSKSLQGAAAGGMGDSSSLAHSAAAAAAGAGSGQPVTDSSSAFAGLQLRLKPDVRLHMYSSKVPCGDACDFNRPALRSGGPSTNNSDSNGTGSNSSFHFSTAKPRQQLPSLPLAEQASQGAQMPMLPSQAALGAHWPQGSALLNPERAPKSSGRLRFKVRDGENCSPVPSAADAAAQAAAAAAVAGSAAPAGAVAGTSATTAAAAEAGSGLGGLRKVCCSDKIAMRNALGLQGALLGQLLTEPVYLSSLTIGGPASAFCEGAVCRAVCCRLAPDLSGLYSTSSGGGDFDCGAVSSSAGRDGDSSGRASKRQHLLTDNTPAGPAAGSADAGAAASQLLQLPAKLAAAAQRGLVLPAPYRVNHPAVQYAAPDSPHSRWLPRPGGHRSSSRAESLNWNSAERDVLEICSSATGTVLQTISVSPPADDPAAAAAAAAGAGTGAETGSGETGETAPGAGAGSSSACSRLSKAALFGWYKELSRSAAECAGVLAEPQDIDMQVDQGRRVGRTAATGAAGVPTGSSYAAAKARNVGYLSAKALLHQHFQQRTQQDWLKVTAVVPELEQFPV